MHKLMVEDKLIQLFDGSHPVHKDCKIVITKLDNNKYVIARTLDSKHALMELIDIFDTDKKIRKFLQHDDLIELRERYEYTFNI